jgi:non-canonical (house-cleaning) NTP pyrophosphatase
MKTYKIAVGTSSDQKLSYLKEILNELEISYKLLPVNADSKISSQPLTSLETKSGSVNRAKEALEKNPESDFSIGIEVGYKLIKGRYHILCWSTVIEKDGREFSAKSSNFKLPKYHDNILKNNQYLGDYVQEYADKCPNGIHKIIGEEINNRRPYIKSSIKKVLVYYLMQSEFN